MLCFRQLLVEGLGRVEFEGHGRFTDSDRSRFLIHLLALQIALQRIQKQPVVGYAVPVEHLLLLLSSDAVVLVQEVKECALRFLQCRIGAGFEIAQIGENAFFELLRVLHRTTERLESKREASDDVCTGNVEEVAPVKKSISSVWLDLSSVARTIECKRRSHRSEAGNVESAGQVASRQAPTKGSISLVLVNTTGFAKGNLCDVIRLSTCCRATCAS